MAKKLDRQLMERDNLISHIMFDLRKVPPTLKSLFASVLILAGFFSNRADAVIRDGGIDPTNLSRGSWIYIMPTAIAQLGGNVSSVSNLTSLMTYMKNQGLQYVIIKAAQADTVFTVSGATNFTPAIVEAGHAAGLKVFGYIYTTGANVPGEITMCDFIFQQGADGLIYDAEIEWETVGGSASVRSNLAIQLCSTVRTNWPNKFMGLSTWPYRASHPNLPYKEFAYYCDVIMPQVYWLELGDSPSVSVATMNSQWNTWKSGLSGIWTNAIKPFVGTGQGWSGAGTVTAAQIWEFENALRTNSNPASPGGYKNVDYWRAELHPASIWAAIKTNFLGRPYTNAPTIEYAPAATPSSSTASISWPTDQVSDSIVEYGLTTSYGTSVTNLTLLWYHTVSLSGLSPDTAYHYRVKSKGTNNLTGVSGDYVFTTPSATVADIIIDQDSANNSGGNAVSYVGTWTDSSGSAYLGTFKYASPNYSLGTPTRTAKFTPNIGTAGNYDVYASWASSAAGGNRATNAPFRITYNGGSDIKRVSEEANGNSFQLLFTNKNFAAGTAGYVEAGNDVTLGVGGDIVIADAVKLVYIPPPPSAPSISAQPQNFTTNQGGSVTFSVTASGTASLTYQWKFNGANISGATQSSYTKTSLLASDAGSYSVGITNAVGSSNSANAVLTVNTGPPGIAAQPQSLIVTQGNNATFTVTSTGSPAYQWKFNGGNIGGATQSSYTKSNAQAGDAGSYSVFLTNIFGSTNSANAILTVRIPPAISTQPANLVVTQGNSATFTVAASGDATLGYVWRKNGSPISGATQTSHTLNPSQISDAGTYSVVITNGVGSITSSNALLSVLAPPAISIQPQSQTVTQTSNVTFTVSASGNPAPGYQWRINGTNISGATASSYTKTNAQTADAGSYSVLITNYVASTNSANGVLTVATPPIITAHPQNIYARTGGVATFTVTASGDAPLTYQWRFNGGNIASATDSNLLKTSLQLSDAGTYSVVVSNAGGIATSDDALLSVTLMTPAHIDSIFIAPDKKTHLLISGELGNYEIQEATIITTWLALTNFTATNSPFEFIDTRTDNVLRYYRARTLP